MYAEAPMTFDNIYYKWLPEDIHEHEGGSHNGKNYLAYTFYIENTGEQTSDYWTELAEAAKLEAEGEAEYMRLLAEAYNSDDKKEFYTFTLALDALKKSLTGTEKTVILDADSDLAKILMGAN